MRLAIYGTKHSGGITLDTVEAIGGYEVVAFIDDKTNEDTYLGTLIYSFFEGLDIDGIVTTINDGEFRLTVADRAEKAGIATPTLIHPTAVVSPSAVIGTGSWIGPGAIVGPRVVLGKCCRVSFGVVLSHDIVIGEGCSIAGGSTLGGGVVMGRLTTLGMHAATLPYLTIGNNTIIGAGAVVTNNVPDNVIAKGVPARWNT